MAINRALIPLCGPYRVWRTQPAHQLGALAEAPLLGGTHFHVREFGFDCFQHPRQRDGEGE
jgi:hypothetical protein